MEKYVITITGIDKENASIRTLKNTFADKKSAMDYVLNKYHRAKCQILTSEERRNGTVYKCIYKIYGENNRISIYMIKIHHVLIEGDVYNEEKKNS